MVASNFRTSALPESPFESPFPFLSACAAHPSVGSPPPIHRERVRSRGVRLLSGFAAGVVASVIIALAGATIATVRATPADPVAAERPLRCPTPFPGAPSLPIERT